MPSFSAYFPSFLRVRNHSRLLAFLIAPFFPAIFSCDNPKMEEPERTEPWKKEAEDVPSDQSTKKRMFQVAPGQILQFELPGRQARPEGAVGGISGHILVNLNALQFVSGELHFDLQQLRVVPESTRPSLKKKNGTANGSETTASEPYDGTKLAHQWLGLDAQVPHHEKNRRATFVIESARDLSHPNAYSGALRKPEDGAAGEVRQVYLSAVGQLKMRGLSVDRLISLTAKFYFPKSTKRGSVPSKISISLRGATHVPLAEYEISPRDAAGHVISEQLDLLGPVIGSVAKMSGTIEFLPNSEFSADEK